MSNVLEYVRSRAPDLADVPDEALTLYVGERAPDLLGVDKDFRDAYWGLRKEPSLQPVLPDSKLNAKTAKSAKVEESGPGSVGVAGVEEVPYQGPARNLEAEAAVQDNARRGEEITQRYQAAKGLTDDPNKLAELDAAMGEELRGAGVTLVRPEVGAMEAVSTPLAQTPKWTKEDVQTLFPHLNATAADVIAGSSRGVYGMVDFFLSPLGVATLGTGSLPLATRRAVSLGFAADMARHAPEEFGQLGTALGEGRYGDAAEHAVGGALNVYFAGRSAEEGLGIKPDERAGLIGKALLKQMNRPEMKEALAADAREEALKAAGPGDVGVNRGEDASFRQPMNSLERGDDYWPTEWPTQGVKDTKAGGVADSQLKPGEPSAAEINLAKLAGGAIFEATDIPYGDSTALERSAKIRASLDQMEEDLSMLRAGLDNGLDAEQLIRFFLKSESGRRIGIGSVQELFSEFQANPEATMAALEEQLGRAKARNQVGKTKPFTPGEGEAGGSGEVKRAEARAPDEEETQSEVGGVAVRRVKAGEIATRPELMQFKRMDERATGTNENDKLSGDWDELKAGNLLLWEPLKPEEHGLKPGEKYIVANGHHRLVFGKEQGVEDFNSQVIREADGYSAEDARALGAEINIADGKGTIYDQAKFIRNEAATHGADAAMARAGQIGARGRKAATIGIHASDTLFESFVNERISPEQAEAIASAAPGDEGLQRVGIQAAQRGSSPAEAANLMQAVRANSGAGAGKAIQVDLFGKDDAALKAAEAMAAVAGRRQKELSEQIAAVQGAAKRPEQAAKLGVDVRDPAALAKRIEELKGERERWRNWSMHPDLVKEVRGVGEIVKGEAAELAIPEVRADVDRLRKQFGVSNSEALAIMSAETNSARRDLLEDALRRVGVFKRPGDRFGGHHNEAVEEGVSEALNQLNEGLLISEEGPAILRDFRRRPELYAKEERGGKPKLRPMENQGDLLSGQTEDFALAGEKGTDFERIQKEKEAKEKAKRESEKGQTELAGLGGGGGFASKGKFRDEGVDKGAAGTGEVKRAEARAPVDVDIVEHGEPVKFGGMEFVRPMELPELVRLAERLTGKVPFLKRYPTAYGAFYPLGTGRIGLHPNIFKMPGQAAKTLAHEIGHLADYLPDRTMDRGNILGRIATLKNWLTTTLPMKAFRPLSDVLTPKDRRRIRREAEKQAGARPPKHEPEARLAWSAEVSEIYRQKVDEEIEARGLMTRDEMGEELWALSQWWKPVPDGAKDSYLDYRRSSPELYADALSVLLNAPAELKRRAPKFWDAFFEYLERKPEVKQAYLDLQAVLERGPEAVAKARMEHTRAGYEKAETTLLERMAEKDLRRKSWKGFWLELKQKNVDQAEFIRRAVKRVEAMGVKIPKWADPREAWEQSLFSNNRQQADVRYVFENVVKPVEDAGMDIHTLGLALEYQRTAGSGGIVPEGVSGSGLKPAPLTREGLANPQGMEAETARATLIELYRSLGEEKARILEQALHNFRELVFARVTEGAEVGIYSRKLYDEVLTPNRHTYAAFRGLDHVDTFVSPMARRAIGTLGQIENPFHTTLLKLGALNNLILTQRAKGLSRDFFKEHFPESWKDVDTYWDGKGQTAVRRVADGLARLEMLQDGHVVAYDVDPAIAEAFEKLSPARVSPLLRLLDVPFRNVIYPLIIKYNPGFQLAMNPLRDFGRTRRNMGADGKLSTWALLKGYKESVGSAVAFIRGHPDAMGQEMMDLAAIGTPMDTYAHEGFSRADGFGEILKRYGLAGKGERSAITRMLMKPAEALQFVGSVLESLPKFASYRALLKKGWSPLEAAPVVRNYAGTPNYRVKGLHGNVANVLVPFSNIFIQGYRTDAELAVKPTTRGGWWLRWMLGAGGLAVAQGLAQSGVLGDGLKQLMGGISEYDKTNYTVIPLGHQTGGDFGLKTVYLRIPRDESSRFLSGAVYKLTRLLSGDRAARTVPTEVFAMGAGIVPTINPLLQMGDAWKSYLEGQNPLDPWRGRPVIGDREFKAGGWDSLKPMMGFTLDKLGVLNFVRWNKDAETTTELVLSALPALNRVLKISDQGHREEQWQGMQEEERTRAIGKLEYSAEVRSKLSEYYRLTALGQRRTAAQQGRFGELSAWHLLWNGTDEVARMLDERGEKAAASKLRTGFNEMDGKVSGKQVK